MRHGCCTAELIVWYVMKQLIFPPDINAVTMQKEILTPPKVTPATLDQGCAWLEEMQHRLSLCIKTKQNVHPRTIVVFVNDTLSGITQYDIVPLGTSGTVSMPSINCENPTSLWIGSALCLRSSSLNSSCMKNKTRLLRYSQALAAPLSTPCMMSTSMLAKGRFLRKEKVSKAMAKAGSLTGEHHMMIIGSQAVAHKDTIVPSIIHGDSRCAICGSTRHNTSQCTRPAKPKAKNAEWDDSTWHYQDDEWYDAQWESEEYEASKGKKGKGK